jgi:hypothetical protein
MIPIFMAVALLAAAVDTVPPPPPSTPPAQTAPSAAPPTAPAAPVLTEDAAAAAAADARANTLMTPYKGRHLAELSKWLGPSESMRMAKDGKVIYWRARTQGGTACGMNSATGAFSCDRAWGKECLLAVAVNLQGDVTAWKLTGEAAACDLMLTPAPAQP